MFDLEIKKEKEIENMVSLLMKMDETGIKLLTRDANTLLMRQEMEKDFCIRADTKGSKQPA